MNYVVWMLINWKKKEMLEIMFPRYILAVLL